MLRQQTNYSTLLALTALLFVGASLSGCSLFDDPDAPKTKIIYAIKDIPEDSPVLEEDVDEKEINTKKAPKTAITDIAQLDCQAAKYSIQAGQIIIAEDLKPLKDSRIKIELTQQWEEKLEAEAKRQDKTPEALAREFLEAELTASAPKVQTHRKTTSKRH